MRLSKLLVIPLFIFCTGLSLNAEEEKSTPTFESLNKDEIAQTLGHLIAKQLDHPEFKLDVKQIIQGISDEQNGVPSPLTEQEYEQAMYVVQEHLFSVESNSNLDKAVAFLKENSKKQGVHSIDEQIQYTIQNEGKGDEVTSESCPLIHYKGSLIDGTVFASSLDAGEPITLPIGQTIPGFSKGMVGMKEGEKRTLYIHPELAYGAGGHLPPNSLLIFEVEVLKAHTEMEEGPSLEVAECENNEDFTEA